MMDELRSQVYRSVAAIDQGSKASSSSTNTLIDAGVVADPMYALVRTLGSASVGNGRASSLL